MKCFLSARGEVVGWMEPTFFDNGMNVVSGPFQANENYAEIQSLVRKKFAGQVHSQILELELRVLDVLGLTQENFARFWRDVFPDLPC